MESIKNSYVVYDRKNEEVLDLDTRKSVLFSDKKEAITYCYGLDEVIKFSELPSHVQERIINQ
jgi:hypothetical protein